MEYVITKFRGEFLSDYDEEHCSWTYISSRAKTYPTYDKAYYRAKWINQKYGHKVACVQRKRY